MDSVQRLQLPNFEEAVSRFLDCEFISGSDPKRFGQSFGYLQSKAPFIGVDNSTIPIFLDHVSHLLGTAIASLIDC
jgi:hypothetical protein